MRVIITGGTGLIGRALVESLVADGHEAIVLSRSPEKTEGFPSSVQVVGWDARTTEGWGELVNGVDAIVNLAGESIAGKNPLAGRWTPERKRRIRESRVQAGQAVVQAIDAAEHKPGVLIQSSAVGYYGPSSNEVITEQSAAGDDFLASVCQDWEAATAPVESMGVRRVVLRTGVVLSMEGGALPLMMLPFRFVIAGGPMGDGKQWVSWIHLQDEIRAIRFLLENKSAQGVYNLSTPNPLQNADFNRAIGRVMKRPAIMPAPGFALKAVLGEMATTVLDGQRVAPTRLQEAGFEFEYTDAESALRDLLK